MIHFAELFAYVYGLNCSMKSNKYVVNNKTLMKIYAKN